MLPDAVASIRTEVNNCVEVNVSQMSGISKYDPSKPDDMEQDDRLCFSCSQMQVPGSVCTASKRTWEVTIHVCAHMLKKATWAHPHHQARTV